MSSSTSPRSTPTFIYKIVDGSTEIPLDVSLLPDVLEVSDLDKTSGYIHLSTSSQIPGTLERFFGTFERIILLRVSFPIVENNIKWEEAAGQLFPHLYNGLRLGKSQVESVRVLEKEKSSSWEKSLDDAKDWLIY